MIFDQYYIPTHYSRVDSIFCGMQNETEKPNLNFYKSFGCHMFFEYIVKSFINTFCFVGNYDEYAKNKDKYRGFISKHDDVIIFIFSKDMDEISLLKCALVYCGFKITKISFYMEDLVIIESKET